MRNLLFSFFLCLLPTMVFATDLAHPVSGYDEKGNFVSGLAYSNEWHSGVSAEIAETVFIRTFDGYASGAVIVTPGIYSYYYPRL